MKNLNLIRKIAWEFTKKTELDYEELFSEAALAYSEALNSFDPSREIKFITYAMWCMKNHLVNVCKYQNYYTDPRNGKAVTKSPAVSQTVDEWPEYLHPTVDPEPINVWEIIETWPKDCREMAETVLEHPEKFLAYTPNCQRKWVGPKRRLKKVERHFERQGWKPGRIQQAVEAIQSQLQIV